MSLSQITSTAEEPSHFDSPDDKAQPEVETPRYLRDTFSSKSSGSSQHAEVERLLNSFRANNYVSLQQLPANIKPGAIEESKRKSISSGRSSKPEYVYRAKSKSVQSQYFTPVTYSRDEYMKVNKNEKTERQYKELTSLSFSRKPFTYATSRIRLKNEDIFGDEKYKFPVLGPGAGVSELETVVRTDFTDATKMLHGPFFVPAKVQPACRVSRDELALWAKEVYTRLGLDWPHLRFSLRCMGEDELVVSFDLPSTTTSTTTAPCARGTSKKDLRVDSPNQCDDTLHPEPQTQSQDEENEKTKELGGGEEEEEEECVKDYGVNPTLVTALGRYMNTMALHGVANHRRFRKRGDRWKVFEFEKEKEIDKDRKRDKENVLSEEKQRAVALTGKTRGKETDSGSRTSDEKSREAIQNQNIMNVTDNIKDNTANNSNSKSKSKEKGKYMLIFSFYTPWYTAATRQTQQQASQQERLSARRFVQQSRAASSDSGTLSVPRRHSAGPGGSGRMGGGRKMGGGAEGCRSARLGITRVRRDPGAEGADPSIATSTPLFASSSSSSSIPAINE